MKVLHCRGLPMVAMIEKQQQQGKELFVAISWQGDHSERNNSRRRVWKVFHLAGKPKNIFVI